MFDMYLGTRNFTRTLIKKLQVSIDDETESIKWWDKEAGVMFLICTRNSEFSDSSSSDISTTPNHRQQTKEQYRARIEDDG